MKYILVMMLSAVVFTASADSLSESQQTLLQKAHQIGEPYDLSLAVMGVLFQETRAGKLGSIGDIDNGFGERSYGVMQIKLDTAEHITQDLCPDLSREHQTEEEMIVDLIQDEIWSMHLATCYLRHLRTGRNWREMLLAYNQGPAGAEIYDENSHHYVLSIVNQVTEGGIIHNYIEETL